MKVEYLLLPMLSLTLFGENVTMSIPFDDSINGKSLEGQIIVPDVGDNTILKKDFGTAGCVGIGGKGIAYPINAKWFNINDGAVNFFVRPEKLKNKTVSKKPYFIPIFSVDGGKGRNWSLIFFYNWRKAHSSVQLQSRIMKNGKLTSVYTASRIPKGSFQPEQWTMVTICWNEQDIAMYINGKRIGYNHYGFPTSKKLNPAWKIWFFPREFWGKLQFPGFDLADVKFYNAFLSQTKINELYNSFTIKQKKKARALIAVPMARTMPEIDGDVNLSEWFDASVIPVAKKFHNGTFCGEYGAETYLKHDQNNLMIAVKVPGKAQIKGPDGENSTKVFDGSEFELWWKIPGHNANCQLGIAPNGTWAFRRDRSWEKIKFRRATKQQTNSWSAEMIIPFSEMGITTSKIQEIQFCLHQPLIHDLENCWLVWNDHKTSSKNHRLGDNLGLVHFRKDHKKVAFQGLGQAEYGRFDLDLTASGAQCYARIGEEKHQNKDIMHIQKNLKPGVYEVDIQVKDNQNELCRYPALLAVNDPISFHYTCYAAKKLIRCKIDLRGLEGPSGKVTVCTGLNLLLADSNGRKVAERKFVPTNAIMDYDLPFQELKPGKYQLHLKVFAGDRVFAKVASFERPDDIFLRNPAGLERTVPYPFHPLNVQGNVISTRYIEYQFEPKQIFPRQSTAYGQKQFIRAPELIIKTQNGSVALTAESAAVKEQAIDRIVHEGVLSSPVLKINWKRHIHYDGMIKVDFTVTPVKPVRIKDFRFQLTLNRKNAAYSLYPRYSEEWSAKGKQEIFPCAWLSGEKTGFSIFTHNDKNWLYRNAPLRLERDKNGNAVMSAVMIEKDVMLDQSAEYTLAMMATPSKPPRSDWRIQHACGWGYFKGQTVQVVGWGGMGHPCFKRVSDFSQPNPEGIYYWQKKLENRKGHVTKLFPYLFGGMPNKTAFSDYYGKDCEITVDGQIRPPFGLGKDAVDQEEFYFCGYYPCLNSIYSDYLTYYFNEVLKKYPCFIGMYIDGFYFAKTDRSYRGENLRSVFKEKKEIQNYNLFGTRDHYERCYKIIRANRGPEGILFAHNWDSYPPMMNSFADLVFPGEEFMHKIHRGARVYIDDTPLEKWQSNYNSRLYGLSMQFMGQWAKLGGNLLNKPVEREGLTRPAITMCLLHDVPISGEWYPPVENIWQLFGEQTGLADAEFTGYWQDGALVSTDPQVKISFYHLKKTGQYYVIVGNLGKEVKQVGLQLPAGFVWNDALSHKTFDTANKLELLPGGYRILAGNLLTDQGK